MILIPALPALAFLLLAFQSRARKNQMAWLALAATLVSLAASFVLPTLTHLGAAVGPDRAVPVAHFTVFSVDGASVVFAFAVDRLSLLMLPIILLVSFVVEAFTLKHLAADKRIGWMMALLSLFTAAFSTLALAGGLFATLVSWVLMGLVALCLSAFWWEDKRVVRPSMVMLVCGLVSDVSLVMGAVVCADAFGSTVFSDFLPNVQPGSSLDSLCVFLLVATIARSSQIPIYVGSVTSDTEPSEPAALVNTFGLLSAGSFLAYRVQPLFAMAPWSQLALLVVGSITAPLAAVIACRAFDTRRIFAASTASQAGVILIAFGAGSPTLGVLHLVANAFFAPLLGLVFSILVRACGSRDIRLMGGLWRRMPLVAVFATCGALSLAGVFPFAGYFSRDGIIDALVTDGLWVPATLLLLTSFLSALYIGRVLSYAFLGESDRSRVVRPGRVEMFCLAALAAGTCLLGVVSPLIARFLGTELPWPRVELTMATTLAVAVSVWLCWTIYSVDDRRAQVREGEKPGSSHRIRSGLTGSKALLALPHLLDRIDRSLVLSSLVAALVCCAVAFTVVMGL